MFYKSYKSSKFIATDINADPEKSPRICSLKQRFLLFIKAKPKSTKDEVAGIVMDSSGAQFLLVKIKAVAENGKANKYLIKYLAKELGISTKNISIKLGQTSNYKQLIVEDVTEQQIKNLSPVR